MNARSGWKTVATIYWCPACNLPLISKNCSKCGGTGKKLKIALPCDARLAFDTDIKALKEALRVEFGSEKAYKAIIGEGKIVLLNKTHYIDDMKEVIVDGAVVGRMYYDPIFKGWRFRPSYIGAVRALREGLGKIVEVSWSARPPQIITANDVDEGEMVIVTRASRPIAIGYGIGEGKVKLHLKLHEMAEPDVEQRGASLDDVVKANEYAMYVEESRAKAFVHVMEDKTSLPPVVSFSGGKDSLVALHITLSTLGREVEVLFNNTGIELPETVNNVYDVCSKLGLEVTEAKPEEDKFWKSLRVFGPPAKDYRWCCKVVKLAPLARTVKTRWPSGALNIVGQRAYESFARSASLRVWRNRWVPKLLNISPIHYWTQLHVWLYIFKHKLPVNELYFKGFDRIGCYLCPACTLAEFRYVETTHPELWNKWKVELEEWRKRIGAPKEWIELGLWRWLGPSKTKHELAARARVKQVEWIYEYKKRQDVVIRGGIEPLETPNSYRVVIELAFDALRSRGWLNLLCALKPVKQEEAQDRIEIVMSSARVTVRHTIIEGYAYGVQGLEEVFDVLKTIIRWKKCCSCGGCETICPKGIVEVVHGKPRVTDYSKCIGCKLCLDICPVSDVYVERLILPVVTGVYDVWRRSSRRHVDDVIKTIKELKERGEL